MGSRARVNSTCIAIAIAIASTMGILHSVFRRHYVYVIPKTFPSLHRAPELGILWPHTLLNELRDLSQKLESQSATGKLLHIDHLYRLKSLLQLRNLPLDEALRKNQVARVQRCIDFHLVLWRIHKAILEGDRRALNVEEMEAAVKIMELTLRKRGKGLRREASPNKSARRVSLY